MISEENEAMGGGSEIKAVATLLLGPESHIYRVFQDHLTMPHHKSRQATVMLLLFLAATTTATRTWRMSPHVKMMEKNTNLNYILQRVVVI